MSKPESTNITQAQRKMAVRLAITLVICSLIAVAARYVLTGSQVAAGGDKIWRLSIDISIPAASDTRALKIFPPIDTLHIRKIERNIFHPNITIRNNYEGDKTRRTIYAVTAVKGYQEMSLDFVLHESQTEFSTLAKENIPLETKNRETFLADTEELQISSEVVQNIIATLQKPDITQQQLVNEIYKRTRKLVTSKKQDVLNVPIVLQRNNASLLDKTLSMVALCRAAGIPARIVTGLILKDELEPSLHYWLEAFQDGKWHSYDLKYGYRESVPINYLPIRRNDYNIVQVLKGQLDKVDFELEQEFDHHYLKKSDRTNYFQILDLTRLPLEVRNELAILLLLPLGALITAWCRHVIGVRSFGVFTPTLLALALIYNDILLTSIIFFVICFLAVAGRSFFPVTITRTPRLSIIFTLVAILLVFSVSVLEQFELNQVGKVILLPVIILTTLVDNFYRTADDRGVEIALGRLVWTVIIALLCVPVMQFETLGHLLLQYPEAHISTLALFLLISTYKGMQWINLPILNLLKEPEQNIKKKHKGETED